MKLLDSDVGKEVWLAAFEDQPRERALVLAVESTKQMTVVQVRPFDNEDDGLRECDFDQVESYT